MSMVWRSAQGEISEAQPVLEVIQDTHPNELERLRRENRRLAVSLGGFSAFIASKGMLEEAWDYVNSIHQLDDE
ncbi:hypothetical protein BH23GEM6_BH23GEM6_07180 [soil metagenome]